MILWGKNKNETLTRWRTKACKEIRTNNEPATSQAHDFWKYVNHEPDVINCDMVNSRIQNIHANTYIHANISLLYRKIILICYKVLIED